MEYKVVPFMAQIAQHETTSTVANQLQSLINTHLAQGWEYMRLESVETQIGPSKGCFGFGATPGYVTTFKMAVFKK